MKKKLEYYICDEDRVRCLKCEGSPAIEIGNLAPFIPFDNSEFYVRIRRDFFKDRDECYYNVEFNEGEGFKTIIISDGAKYLPARISEIVKENDYFCIAVRMLNDSSRSDEEISLIIYYGSEGLLLFSDMVHPAGRQSEIFITIDENYGCYLVSYNHHPLVIGNDDSYQCDGKPTTKRLGLIDYADERGVNYLAQCLEYRSFHISKAISGGVRTGYTSAPKS